jgi:hypothetical protein
MAAFFPVCSPWANTAAQLNSKLHKTTVADLYFFKSTNDAIGNDSYFITLILFSHGTTEFFAPVTG